MRKLTLKLDALQVDSFDTGALSGAAGTVRGHDSRVTEFCYTYNCGGATARSCRPCQIIVAADARDPAAE